MRTSNKILLGIFLTPLLILTLIQVALYAKYKSGNYVSMKTVQENRFIRKTLKNISNVKVYGLNNFRIMPSDSLRLEIEKDENSHLHYTITGNSLIIHGDSTGPRLNGSGDIIRSYQAVNLYLPSGATITADNSEVTVQGSKDSLKATSYHFSIVNSGSLKVDENGNDSNHVYFKGLTIQASHSSGIELTAYSSILELQLTMIESAFTDNGASIDKLVINADKASNITLKGDNLGKLNVMH
jgi:hypothetical protein